MAQLSGAMKDVKHVTTELTERNQALADQLRAKDEEIERIKRLKVWPPSPNLHLVCGGSVPAGSLRILCIFKHKRLKVCPPSPWAHIRRRGALPCSGVSAAV